MRRNSILKQEDIDFTLLEVFDEALADAGAEVIAERLAYIALLKEASKENEKKITRDLEVLDIQYESNIIGLEEKDINKEKIKELLQEELIKNKEKDIRSGSTEKGPHRDDFKLSVNSKDLKIYGSQGQKRTASLSIKLAEEKLIKNEIGEDAIILLDDVMSELDEERQKSLIESFKENQIFISVADINESVLSKLPEGVIINIDNGNVKTVSQL